MNSRCLVLFITMFQSCESLVLVRRIFTIACCFILLDDCKFRPGGTFPGPVLLTVQESPRNCRLKVPQRYFYATFLTMFYAMTFFVRPREFPFATFQLTSCFHRKLDRWEHLYVNSLVCLHQFAPPDCNCAPFPHLSLN